MIQNDQFTKSQRGKATAFPRTNHSTQLTSPAKGSAGSKFS
jgi:hypothetical protein